MITEHHAVNHLFNGFKNSSRIQYGIVKAAKLIWIQLREKYEQKFNVSSEGEKSVAFSMNGK